MLPHIMFVSPQNENPRKPLLDDMEAQMTQTPVTVDIANKEKEDKHEDASAKGPPFLCGILCGICYHVLINACFFIYCRYAAIYPSVRYFCILAVGIFSCCVFFYLCPRILSSVVGVKTDGKGYSYLAIGYMVSWTLELKSMFFTLSLTFTHSLVGRSFPLMPPIDGRVCSFCSYWLHSWNPGPCYAFP